MNKIKIPASTLFEIKKGCVEWNKKLNHTQHTKLTTFSLPNTHYVLDFNNKSHTLSGVPGWFFHDLNIPETLECNFNTGFDRWCFQLNGDKYDPQVVGGVDIVPCKNLIINQNSSKPTSDYFRIDEALIPFEKSNLETFTYNGKQSGFLLNGKKLKSIKLNCPVLNRIDFVAPNLQTLDLSNVKSLQFGEFGWNILRSNDSADIPEDCKIYCNPNCEVAFDFPNLDDLIDSIIDISGMDEVESEHALLSSFTDLKKDDKGTYLLYKDLKFAVFNKIKQNINKQLDFTGSCLNKQHIDQQKYLKKLQQQSIKSQAKIKEH